MGPVPGVSVVIPTYNREALLPEALDSVLAQDWPELEVVVVENGSTDGTPELLSEYEKRHGEVLQVIRLHPNQGPSKARNAGILAARHEFIAFLDSDNRWVHGKLERQMPAFAADPSLDLLFAGYSTFGVGAPREVLLDSWSAAPDQALEELLVGCCINTSTVVAKREALKQVGLFDPTTDGLEDYELWLRMAARGLRIGYLAEPLAEYRLHPGSISGDLGRASVLTERVFEQLFSSGDLPQAVRERRRFHLARCYLNSACRYLDAGDGRAAAAALRRGVATRPASLRPGWLRLYLRALASRRSRAAPLHQPVGPESR